MFTGYALFSLLPTPETELQAFGLLKLGCFLKAGLGCICELGKCLLPKSTQPWYPSQFRNGDSSRRPQKGSTFNCLAIVGVLP